MYTATFEWNRYNLTSGSKKHIEHFLGGTVCKSVRAVKRSVSRLAFHIDGREVSCGWRQTLRCVTVLFFVWRAFVILHFGIFMQLLWRVWSSLTESTFKGNSLLSEATRNYQTWDKPTSGSGIKCRRTLRQTDRDSPQEALWSGRWNFGRLIQQFRAASFSQVCIQNPEKRQISRGPFCPPWTE